MPVKSLHSSVLKWPDAQTVDRAVRDWAAEMARRREAVLRIGYFGSYARGNWGVGSDLDIVVVVVNDDRQPFERRGMEWDATGLPVPADVLVYTREEWDRFNAQRLFHQSVMRETVWVFVRGV